MTSLGFVLESLCFLFYCEAVWLSIGFLAGIPFFQEFEYLFYNVYIYRKITEYLKNAFNYYLSAKNKKDSFD